MARKQQKEEEITLSKWVYAASECFGTVLDVGTLIQRGGGELRQPCSLSHSNIHALLPLLSISKQYRKDQKKVDKLTAQIPYHEGRGNKEEVEKIKAQVDAIWAKTREAAFA